MDDIRDKPLDNLKSYFKIARCPQEGREGDLAILAISRKKITSQELELIMQKVTTKLKLLQLIMATKTMTKGNVLNPQENRH